MAMRFRSRQVICITGSRPSLAATTAATKRVLVHGDFSPKNLLAGAGGPVILDAECAWYGDPAAARVVLRYRDNLLGSTDAVAGVANDAGNVMGLMPHPENHIVALQHPHHRRGGCCGAYLGLRMFQAGVAFAKGA